MKNIISFFFILNCTIQFAQTTNYTFLPKGLHPVSEKDTTLKNKSINLDAVSFYSVVGTKLDKMQAVMALQITTNGSDAFLDDKNEIKAIVIRPKTQKEIDEEKIAAATKIKEPFKPYPAPSFTLNLMDGTTFPFDPKQNKELYVINFWFTSCVPCKAEMPGLNKLVEKYKNKKVKFVAVTYERPEKLKEFLKTNSFNYEMTVYGAATNKKFETNSFPTNLIINQEGNVIFKESGLSQDIFEKLDKVIAENVK